MESKNSPPPEKISYDLVHSHYWLSGWVGGQLKQEWSIPLVHMFHTLGTLKNAANRKKMGKEPEERLSAEGQIMGLPTAWSPPLLGKKNR